MPDREMTMVERVAKAIDAVMHREDDTDPDCSRRYARAAIEAMRENTPAMSEAMLRANLNIVGGYDGPSGWEAAIDAALKEHEGENTDGS